jgi:hypothetical protein
VAKFIGFCQFYSCFIHHFELCIAPLRNLTKHEYTNPLGSLWTDTAQAAWDDTKNAIIDNPCLQQFDYRKLVVLRTDFFALGFGYVLLQPGNDDASIQASQDYWEGKGFSFMTTESSATIHPICFGARKCRGNKVWLHSHMGQCFAGDYAIKKMQHYVFGQQFVWVTECYAIKFLLSYEGGNPAILCLQMRLMCWDMDIIHRPDSELVDADYWSHLGANINFNPLFHDYLDYTSKLQKSHPAPMDLPMHPENMPYYRGPRVQLVTKTSEAANALHIQSLLTDIIVSSCTGQAFLSNIPVRFGHAALPTCRSATRPRALLNLEFASYAFQVMSFCWAIYSFSNGHSSSTIQSQHLPFHISLACDTSKAGCLLFAEFTPSAKVFSSGNDLLQHVRVSGETSVIHGYLINSYRFLTSKIKAGFWKLQLAIITQLRLIQSLLVIVAIVMPDHDGRSVKSFVWGLSTANWKVSSRDVSYTKIGNSIVDSCTVIIAVHLSSASVVEPLVLKTPPAVCPTPIASYLWEPFNRPEHSLCFGRDDNDFNKDKATQMIVSAPKQAKLGSITPIMILYHLHRADEDATILAGSGVLSPSSLCLPFEACPTRNLFQHFFGIKFHFDGHACCFNLVENIQYHLSHEKNRFGVDALMPARTSAWVFQQVHSQLVFLRDSNCEVFSPNQFAAPAATVQTLVNGTICTCLPLRERWLRTYNNNVELCIVRELVLNPSLICNKRLSKVNHNYRGPLCQSQISIEDGMLILHKLICGSTSYTCLQLVPQEMYNILFIAFHTNAIGGHLNVYRTLHRLRLRFYWPAM